MDYSYLFQYLDVPDDAKYIVEPFCGEGKALKTLSPCIPHTVECYDINPKFGWTKNQDTLLFPPVYENKFILTHVPSKEINEIDDGPLFDTYLVSHKYKCFIKNLLVNICDGGIIALPAMFWTSMTPTDIKLRQEFQNIYQITHLNIFNDVKDKNLQTNMCTFQFERKNNSKDKNKHVPVIIFPRPNRATFQDHVKRITKDTE